MEEDGAGAGALPERTITADMLVAYNMARWRQANKQTQADLGALMGGWTKGAVSAAERSWDGRRVRRFSAGEVTDLAHLLGVPVPAMFLPPADDGAAARYVIETGGNLRPMGTWFLFYVIGNPVLEDISPAAAAYQQAFIAAEAKYVDSAIKEKLAQDMAAAAADDLEHVKAALGRARANRAAVAGLYRLIETLLEDNDLLQDILGRAAQRGEP